MDPTPKTPPQVPPAPSMADGGSPPDPGQPAGRLPAARRREPRNPDPPEPIPTDQPPTDADRSPASDASTAAVGAPPGEPELRPLDPRVKPRWWVGGVLAALQLIVPVFVIDMVAPHPLPTGRPTMVVVALTLVIAAVVPPIRYRRWRYALRRHDLWIRSGLLTITVSVIPYRRLQFVDTRSSPIDRLFGLAELIVHTAALGTSGRLPGLDADEAERLREALSRVAPDDPAS